MPFQGPEHRERLRLGRPGGAEEGPVLVWLVGGALARAACSGSDQAEGWAGSAPVPSPEGPRRHQSVAQPQ